MLDFDFKVRAGTFRLDARGEQTAATMGLFGPSGCGKTTLLNCLAGLLRPYEGYIRLNGKPLFDSSAKVNVRPDRRRIGYVFQDGRLFGHMTVRANIEYGRRRTRTGPGPDELAAALDIEPFLDRSPETLSAGERQRVALARALAAGPRMLLLDEPLASIDQNSRLRILPYLGEIYEKWQVPCVYVSHSLSEIIFLAQGCWQMCRGRIDRTAHPRDMLAGTSHMFDPILNIIRGSVQDVPAHKGFAIVRCNGHTLKVPSEGLTTGSEVTVALPARDLMLSLSRPQGISARNILPANISRIEQNGHALWVTVQVGSDPLVIELTEDAGRQLQLRPELDVYVLVKSHSITVTPTKENEGHDAR